MHFMLHVFTILIILVNTTNYDATHYTMVCSFVLHPPSYV